MKLKQLLQHFLLAASLLTAADLASASITTTIGAGLSGQQQGRLSRNAVPQSWAHTEAFPGVINTGVTYFYRTFTFNIGSLNYLDIEIDSTSPNTFASAYQTSYNPTSLSTNWLGDAGMSGNSFGADVLFFDVVAAMNSFLTIVVSNTAAGGVGVTDPFTLSVFAFPDSMFTADAVELAAVTRVPEPSTLLLLLAPLGLVAGRKLRARRVAPDAVAA